MKRRFLSVKELAEELGVHEDTIYRAHLKKLIPVKKVCKVLRFDLEKVLNVLSENASVKRPQQTTRRAAGAAGRAPLFRCGVETTHAASSVPFHRPSNFDEIEPDRKSVV